MSNLLHMLRAIGMNPFAPTYISERREDDCSGCRKFTTCDLPMKLMDMLMLEHIALRGRESDLDYEYLLELLESHQDSLADIHLYAFMHRVLTDMISGKFGDGDDEEDGDEYLDVFTDFLGSLDAPAE